MNQSNISQDDLLRLLRAWWPDLLAGLVVFFAGFAETVFVSYYISGRPQVGVLVLGMAVAVALARHHPLVALGVVWVVGLVQLSSQLDIMLVQFAIAYIAFATARWGSTVTLWASLASVPAGVLGGLVFMTAMGRDSMSVFAGGVPVELAAEALGLSWPVMSAAFILTLLLVPWLIGLAVRFGVRAHASEASLEVAEADTARAQRETEQAREIAALREEQARLASDVHDVVGHSLAVILAQAESAQFLDDDPVVLKQTMATIATSARSSLQDIRQVLAGAQQAAAAASPGSYEELIQGVRSSGHEVQATEIGQSRPLPPELEVVAHRVVQEMLTNAIRHGRRDRPVQVERHWPEGAWGQDLRIEVRNWSGGPLGDTAEIPIDPDGSGPRRGQGLEGMRRRLEAVGGKLDVRKRSEPEGQVFTVTAWVPVSGR
ncbi:histidine kinase [Kineosporia rhizophila]|uniref:sensor histidine kinase n=1 Tax=Kineosporia rhizophila TaxID=84633 RepID=UPI001E392A4F|nr:histidine kinase [Kineosporia rhizophila]